ncbi:MAG TPA: hypothetical protein VNJ01_00065 [Bacteriovoracaceae bacterium]|nr:hypothetical protein [Bacteriovoracaceae bacterium]
MPRKTVNTNTRRTKRAASVLESAPKIQKSINRDYKLLFKNYGRLASKLWSRPATRYVVGGAAVAALVPVAMRVYKRYPQISTFFSESLDAVEGKISEIKTFANDMMSSNNDAHH